MLMDAHTRREAAADLRMIDAILAATAHGRLKDPDKLHNETRRALIERAES